MKKTIVISILLILAVTLYACSASSGKDGSNEQTNNSANSNESSKSAVKIKFSSFQSGDVAKDWEQQRFPDFKKETGIDVEHVFIKQEETISTLLMWNTAKKMPDAGMLSANYQSALAAKGMLVNLSEFVKGIDPEYDFSRFFPNLLDAYKYNGNVYALPSDLDLGLLWYNKDLFDKANLPYPDETWTWDDYLNAAQKLTSGDGPGKMYGTTLPGVQTFLWQNGTDFITADGKNSTISNPEAIEAITFVSDLIHKYIVAPAPGAQEDKFQTGKAAMALGNGPWYAHYVLADVKFNWGVAPLPKGKNKATTAYGSTFAIYSASEHKEEAWKFIKWFLSDEQQFIRAKQFSWFPPSASVVQMADFADDSVLTMTKDQKDLVMKETEFGRAPVIVEAQNEINQIIDRELSLVWSGEKKPEDAAKTINQEVQPLLK